MSNFISITHFRLFTLFILLLIVANVAAYTIHGRSYDHVADESLNNDNDDDISSSDIYPRTYRPSYVAAMPSFDLRHGVVRLIPYKKRTIPLELQKALYAHGIVGRKR